MFYAPHAGPPVPVDLDNPGIYATPTVAPHAVATGTDPAKAGNLTFNLVFNDVVNSTTVGFDDATEGATRRAQALAVANYLNDVLNENTGATIDITFNNSQTDGTGFLASAGTFFTLSNGYTSGIAHQHITSGTDPSGSVVDITVTVDFGYTWNSDAGAPAGGEYDLASVLLHEYTHGLGFSAAADASGLSTINGTNPGSFTNLTDGLLRGTGSVDLWNAAFTFVGAAADLISNDVFFTGANATAANGASNPKIYAPGAFAAGSSLSHWDTTTFPTAVMRHSTAAGVTTRQYSAVDIGGLQDIGYSSAADPGVPVPVEISGFTTE
ncbi:MAG: hypothetical protein KJ060_12880 [Candidatus Hydrogenedentes bacterium]|nr:hypothetical protein [Candidatus Hydrogenedentota bacterium]